MILLSMKFTRYFFISVLMPILASILLTGCVNSSQVNSDNAVPMGVSKTQWDFDHQLQYKKTQLTDNTYRLEVISGNRATFERLSAFLLRRGYLICSQYGYKIQILKGVESFDYLRESPNLIMQNLTATIECPINE